MRVERFYNSDVRIISEPDESAKVLDIELIPTRIANLVLDGEVQIASQEITSPHELLKRSAIGFGNDQSIIISAESVTLKQLANIMIHLGCENASCVEGIDLVELALDEPVVEEAKPATPVAKKNQRK